MKKKSMKKEEGKVVNMEIGFNGSVHSTIQKTESKHIQIGELTLIPSIGTGYMSLPCKTIPDEMPAKFESIAVYFRFLHLHAEASYSWIRRTR